MSNNTINKEEVEKFSKIAEEWWNPNGKFKPLHKFNPIRIEYIKNNIIKDFNISSNVFTLFRKKCEKYLSVDNILPIPKPLNNDNKIAIDYTVKAKPIKEV